MLLHQCRCGKVIPQEKKLCDICQSKYRSRHKEYDTKYRNKDSARVYNSRSWKDKVKPIVMQRYSGFDLFVLFTEHRLIKADMVHHIVEVSEDYNKRYEISNLIPLSNKTHAKVSKIYEQGGTAKEKLQEKLSNMVQIATQGGIEKIINDTMHTAPPLFCGENSPRKIP